jgi:hypothetical protein
MRTKAVFILDENITTKKLCKCGEFIIIKKGASDEEIIEMANIVANPVKFFTKNPRHFRQKLKKGDKVIKVTGRLSRDQLNNYLPKAKAIISSSTGLENYEHLTVTYDLNKPILVASTGTKNKIISLQ